MLEPSQNRIRAERGKSRWTDVVQEITVKSVGSPSLIASAIDSCYSMHCKYAIFQPWATVGDRGRSNLLVHSHLLPQQQIPATVCIANMPCSNHGRPWATVGGHICWFTVTYCLSKRFPLQYALRGNVLKGFCQQKSCFPICSRFQQINVHYDHTSFAREVLGYAP